MLEEKRGIFRQAALEHYTRRSEKDILLRLASPSMFRRRVPVRMQMGMVECGAACLAMILSYYGRVTTVAEVVERCGPGRDGLSASAIVSAARSYGLRVRAISVSEQDVRFLPLPAIMHWNFNHFLVVERWSTKIGRAHV